MPSRLGWGGRVRVGFGAGLLVTGAGLLVASILHLSTPAVAAPSAGVVAAPARAEVTRVDLAPGGEARYRAMEVLSGRGVNEAIGRTNEMTGSLLFDVAGSVVPEQSRVTVDLRNLQSDSAMRDRYIQRTTLQTMQYPTAEFVLTAAPGLPLPLPASGTAAFELVGDLTLHGITRPATWQATATFGEADVTGTATTTVLLTDFGMEPPRAGPVLSIEDAVRLELDVRAVIAPSIADLLDEAT
ncbi:MAG: YceI family protein [Chloroflexi bacterium]|nr:YceI family protein [Chloroflexota bacterium]